MHRRPRRCICPEVFCTGGRMLVLARNRVARSVSLSYCDASLRNLQIKCNLSSRRQAVRVTSMNAKAYQECRIWHVLVRLGFNMEAPVPARLSIFSWLGRHTVPAGQHNSHRFALPPTNNSRKISKRSKCLLASSIDIDHCIEISRV